ncbi:predicted protein [Chaetoceros tenuissimus]|uniref:Helicase-associated domain-containing protein n=1 Tax=Chaetoceros tenuissimus TaxID=426638 RepID=A0AAD3DC67_9STRA|nr:predicted protein [Chaetoceros tenuissimus]
MERENSDSSYSSPSSSTASSRVLASSEIKQEDDDDDSTLQYQRNFNKILDRYTERYDQLTKGKQMQYDKKFDKNFEDLVSFHHEHGHWQVPSTKTRLYRWLHNIHQIYRYAYYDGERYEGLTFPKHRYEKLVAIGYPFKEIMMQEMTPEEEDDSSTTSTSDSRSSTSSSAKVKREEEEDISTEYQSNLEKVLDEYTERYEAQPENLQIRYDKIFDMNVQNLADFHSEFGHWKVPHSQKELYRWLIKIHIIYRCAYFNGERYETYTLPRHRYEKLVAIGYPFEEIGHGTASIIGRNKVPACYAKFNLKEREDGSFSKRNLDKVLDEFTEWHEKLSEKGQQYHDKMFEKYLQQFAEFHRVYGHWNVPCSRKYIGLFDWLKCINQTYKEACVGRQGYLFPRHHYEQLVAMGYTFEVGDSYSTIARSSSVNASNENANCSDEEDKTMDFQRNLETVLEKYTKRYEKMSKKKQNIYDKQFDARIEKLVDFYKKYGHWKVPRTVMYCSLNTWVGNIHRIFRCAYYDGKCYSYGILAKHRYSKLVAIGFPFEFEGIGKNEEEEEEEEDEQEDFEACERKLDEVIEQYTKRYKKLSKKQQRFYDDKFDMKLNRLCEFHSKNGHWKVPRSTSIYNWLEGIQCTYEKAYFKGQQNHYPHLPRHRYKKLVEIGYPFQEFWEDVTPENDDDSSITQTTYTLPALIPKAAAAHASTFTSDSNPQSKNRLNACMKSAEKSTSTNERTATIQTVRNGTQTISLKESEVESLQAKISQLEKENESHYDTIYRLKDEKESLLEKLEEQNKQLNTFKRKLDEYKKKEQSLEQDDMKSTSSSSKRQRTSSQPRDAEIERLQQERQLLIDQLTASTENYRKLLDLIPRSQTK